MSFLIIVLIGLLNFLMWQVYRRRSLNRLLVLAIWTALVVWYFIPGMIAAVFREETPFTPFYLLKPMASRTTWVMDFSSAFLIEGAAVAVTLVVAWLVFPPLSRQGLPTAAGSDDLRSYSRLSVWPKLVALGVFLLTLMYQVANSQGDYLSANSAELYGSVSATSHIIFGVFKPVSYSMMVLIAVFERKTRPLMGAAFLAIASESFLAASAGGRINILAPLIVYVFRKVMTGPNLPPAFWTMATQEYRQRAEQLQLQRQVQKQRWRKRLNLGLSFLGVLVVIVYGFLPIAQALEEVRATGKVDMGEVFVRAFLTPKETATAATQNPEESTLATIFGKLDAFTTGSLLVTETGYGKAGVNPYLGSFLMVMPRPLFPNKPVAGTADGTIQTHPSRLVVTNLGVKSDSLNMGVSPTHIAFWQFSYAGFLVTVVAFLLNFKFLNWLLNSRSILHAMLALYTMNIPTFAAVFPSPDVVLRNFMLVLTFLLVIEVVRYLNPGKLLKRVKV